MKDVVKGAVSVVAIVGWLVFFVMVLQYNS